jgi:diguanylate cyclase (GGDEF)-like protein/PAS domain S-box-containing protein
MRLLLVERDAPTRNALAESLKLAGYAVTARKDAVVAWDAFSTAPFPIVICPFLPPDGRAPSLCRRIRDDHRGKMTTIVVTSTRSDAGTLSAIVDAGADDFVLSSVDPNTLLARLELAMRRRRKDSTDPDHGETPCHRLQDTTQDGNVASEQRLRLALAAAQIGTWDWDLTTGELVWSREMEHLSGVAEGRSHTIDSFFGLVHPDDKEDLARAIQCVLDSGMEYAKTFRMLLGDGSIRWHEAVGRLERDTDGRPLHFRGITMDVTASKMAEEALQDAHAQLGRVIGAVSDCLYSAEMLPDGSFSYRYFSPVALRTLGRPAAHFLASPERWLEILHPDDRVLIDRAIDQVKTGQHSEYATELRIFLPDGSIRWIQDSVRITPQDNGNLWLDGVLTDITERKAFEAELHHRALHDALTGLPNRPLFLDRLAHALARRRSSPNELRAVLFLDLDNFKTVNDGLGHEAGDELLRAVAARLAKRVRTADTLARFGGDEFVVLLEDLMSPEDAPRIADELIAGFATPITVQGREVYMGISIGIALAGPQDTDPSLVLRNADAALYRAKSSGRNRSVLFDPHMTREALARLELEADLRRALEDGSGLLLHYQPVFDLRTRRLSGCEALVRWVHPTGATLLPDAFIPLAEETGLIVPLGQWVLTEACRQLREWQLEFGAMDLTVSVNISSGHFREQCLVQQVGDVLAATGLLPANLTLEVTERVLVDAVARKTLTALKDLGVGLAIDDFGTGYSSLNYLSAIDADILKIDRRFVSDLTANGREAAIVRAILALGESLDMTVVAEGIETVDQMLALRRLGCHRVQGFLFGRPVPADHFVGVFESLPPSRRCPTPAGEPSNFGCDRSGQPIASAISAVT